ncbi:ATP-binding protein [Brevibacillus daliensis]|uniref:ATP-binding protein n=1 Tax=Brevibacillus daliensis TaxID=2892995 RepID=UPI001E30F72F|nr:sensor histidine kinase [Brevibacillus daliensis]
MKAWSVSLQTKMVLLITLVIACIVGNLALLFSTIITHSVEEQIGKRALSVAKTVANMETVISAFELPNPSSVLQPLAEGIRLNTEAEYIVIGNREGIRYTHPIESRIGHNMVGGDNQQALLYGQSYVSRAVGSLGPAVRGKVPIRDNRGSIIGIVSVGFLTEDIQEISESYRDRVFLFVTIAIITGILGALLLSRHFKKAIFGLEPEEIAAVLVERNAVLQSVNEGIIVINKQGKVTLVNQAAITILDLPDETEMMGQNITNILPGSKMLEVLETGEQHLDRPAIMAGKEILVSRIPIKAKNKVIGVVCSFRSQSKMNQVVEELTQAKRYSEALRAQTHEFHNLLYTISGLLQLGSVQEAVDLVTQETSSHQELTLFLAKAVPDPLIGALLIGLTNRARELKIQFKIDSHSKLRAVPAHINRQEMVSVIGNIIQNAFEAVLESDEKKVSCYLSDVGNELLFEVEDSGPGIRDDLIDKIFESGFSTKSPYQLDEKRGIGLAKVKQIVTDYGGYIIVGKSEWGGALFIVALPKKGGESLD